MHLKKNKILIMSRLKIKPTYPDTPSLKDADWTFRMTRDDLDFLEELTMPTKALWYRGFPLESYTAQKLGYTFPQGDLEDISTSYRANRDARIKAYGTYWEELFKGNPLSYFNGILVNHYLYEEHQKTRFQFPSIDGSMNYPEFRLVDQEFNWYIHPESNPYREISFKLMDTNRTTLKSVIDDFVGFEIMFNDGTIYDDVYGGPYRSTRDAYRKALNDKYTYLTSVSGEYPAEAEAALIQAESDYNAALQNLLDNPVSIYDENVSTESYTYGYAFTFTEDGEFNILNSVTYTAELAGIQGTSGDFIYDMESGYWYHWKASENKWNISSWGEDLIMSYIMPRFYWKSKGLNELVLGMKPFVTAAHHAPVMWLFDEIKGAGNRVISADFAAINASLNAANA